MNLRLGAFGLAACLFAGPALAQQMPTTWGDCMFNGGWMGAGSATSEQWCKTNAKLTPSGGGQRGMCMYEQGKLKTQRAAAKKKCGIT